MSPVRWVALAALVASVIGLLLPWGTVNAAIVSASVTGLSTSDGKLLGLVLLAVAATGGWRYLRSNRINGVVFIAVWFVVAVIAVAEIVHFNNATAHTSAFAQVGAGLYLNAIAGFIGLGAAVVDTARLWSSTVQV